MTMKTACAYIRVSSQGQVEHGRSLEEQRADIEQYTSTNNVQIAGSAFYIDAGKSGRKEREAFNRMVADVKTGMYDLVIVWKSDRLTREVRMGYELRDSMEAGGAEFYSVTEGDMLNNRMMFGQALLYAEHESIAKADRARMGHRARAKAGQVHATLVKYGYERGEDGFPVVNGSEAEAVRYIFAEYVAGTPILDILAGMQSQGMTKRSDAQWAKRQDIQRTIASTEYIGRGFANQSRFVVIAGKGKRLNNPESEWISVTYPAIIDTATWDAAQRRVANTKGLNEGKNNLVVHFPLRGLLYCECCGLRMTPQGKAASPGRGSSRSYRSNGVRRGRGRCSVGAIGAVGLERRVTDAVRDMLANPDTVRSLIEARRQTLKDGGTYDELDRVRKNLEKIDLERTRKVKQHTIGAIDDDELEIAMRDIKTRRDMYLGMMAGLESEVNDVGKDIALLEDFERCAGDVLVEFDATTPKRQAEIIGLMIPRVDVSRDEARNVALNMTIRPLVLSRGVDSGSVCTMTDYAPAKDLRFLMAA